MELMLNVTREGGEMRVKVARRGARLEGGAGIQELLDCSVDHSWGGMFFRGSNCQVREVSFSFLSTSTARHR
jgi:hypothetical protein